MASTLNPYYEGNSVLSTILDDRFIFHTLDKWHFGADFTGNLMNEQNMYALKEHCDNKLGPVHLVTSDGSIDCLERPEDQEEVVARLHIAELLATLLILADQGNMILKMFTFFENSSLGEFFFDRIAFGSGIITILYFLSEILYIMNCCFDEVHVFKPATSKEGNSEVYVIAKKYNKQKMPAAILLKMIKNFMDESKCLLPVSEMPESFIRQVIVCAEYFGQKQKNVIEANIRFYWENDKWEIDRIRKLREYMARVYMDNYGIQRIPDNKKLLAGIQLNNFNLNNLNVKDHCGKELK